ncbi:hypothetical protein LRS74_07835 [Streptomyces sp. LX-29]|uniref:hypothetical protein n=1 Tax=Streptomyces sp. LX-29 TaxID=2900152 RepID=UPI00240DDF7B|nr:hypothetical protein [Streptomyces sp. LX-29]WFB06969.1 hypothetical protein LRS74_07835 [Streptomyces sp. LX-29]
MGDTETQLRLVVSAGVCGPRTACARAELRAHETVYDVVDGAFARIGVRGSGLLLMDRPGGLVASPPAELPAALLAGEWLEEVHQRLRQDNAERAVPLRLRIALHRGPVARRGDRLAGSAVELACRLCDGEVAEHTLSHAPEAPLLCVVSAEFFREVVAEGGRFIEPEHYREARGAWYYMPRLAAPPLPDEVLEPPDAPASGESGAAEGAPPWVAGVPMAGGPAPGWGGGVRQGGCPPPTSDSGGPSTSDSGGPPGSESGRPSSSDSASDSGQPAAAAGGQPSGRTSGQPASDRGQRPGSDPARPTAAGSGRPPGSDAGQASGSDAGHGHGSGSGSGEPVVEAESEGATYHFEYIGGDSQIFQGNTIHGDFTGIRKGGRGDKRRRGFRGRRGGEGDGGR